MASARFIVSALSVFSSMLPTASVSSYTQQMATFNSFIQKYGRPYEHGSAEYEERFALFSRRIAEVEAHNAQPHRLWNAGINVLSDRTHAELARLRGWRGSALPGDTPGGYTVPAGRSFLEQSGRSKPLPREWTNWTKLRSLLEVRDQGSCGSCWAVTSATVLEAHSEIYNSRSPRSFSVQEFVSCTPNPHKCGGGGGCQGATVELAYNYAMKHGLATENETPYLGADSKCSNSLLSVRDFQDDEESAEDLARPGVHVAKYDAPGALFGMKAWERLKENDYESLMHAVWERGPVAVSVAAHGWANYKDGIFNSCARDAVVDHAVTLVGYGEDAQVQEKYWIIQNSWTANWGEAGKIRLLRRDDDSHHQNCGVDSQPELGTGCEGGPKNVTVCGQCGILYDSVVPHFA